MCVGPETESLSARKLDMACGQMYELEQLPALG